MKQSGIRQKILDTASDLFYKNGYNRTGINEVISESGIAKATLYHHFKSKEDLCIAYLAYKNETFLTEISAFCQSRDVGKSQVLAIFDFLSKFFEDGNFNGCWCIRTIAEIPKENQKIRNKIQQHKEDFLVFIKSLLSENFPHKEKWEIAALSRQIYLLYEGAISESHLHQEKWPIEAAKQMAQSIL
ncbi:MAG: TetR/AcrR family transcriptional regulator [Bacteroidota bacterium]